MSGFGTTRRLPSKRWQARYFGPDGLRRSAPYTFASKTAAQQWLRQVEMQMVQGDWTDPERARITLGDYAAQWIEQRPGLRPRTVQLYKWLLRKHIDPYIGGVPIGQLSAAIFRNGVLTGWKRVCRRRYWRSHTV